MVLMALSRSTTLLVVFYFFVALLLVCNPVASKAACTNDAFIYAIAYGRTKVVQDCVQGGLNIEDVYDAVGCPPLVIAARGGHTDIVQFLHQAGAYQRSCLNGYGSVYFARLNGHDELVQLLLSLGNEDEELETHFDECSLQDWAKAIRSHHIEDAHSCVIHGTKIETHIDGGCAALTVAVINRSPDGVRFLLHHGAELEARCNDGTTPLMHAARTGQLNLVKMLVDAGADIETKVKHSKWSALTFATTAGNLDIAKYLHRIEENFHEDEWKGGPLMWAAAAGQTDMIKRMIRSPREAQRDINKQDEHGQTALMWAAINDHLPALITVFKAGGDINTRTRVGWTPLMAAAYHGHTSIVEYTLRNGAHIDDEDLGGWTALMWAVVGGHTDVVKRLLQDGASSSKTFSGWSPMLVACASGREEIFNVLLQNGDDSNMELSDGRNCEALAREGEHYTLADHIMGIHAAAKRYSQHHEEL
eukprot:m.84197 g.84197  ORF g.84197 m.84197 type:complete len:476 (-) comp12150_c0_seq1:1259-2686(-)